jgi:hypothetical protein
VTADLDAPEPEPFFDAVGRVAFAWNELEIDLIQLLVALLHAPSATVLLVGQSFGVVSSHIKAILDLPPVLQPCDARHGHLTPAQRQRIKEVLRQSNELAERRHRIVHGRWIPIDPGHWLSVRQRRHKIVTPAQSLTTDEIYGVARDIEALSLRIQLLGGNIDHDLFGLAEAPALEQASHETASPKAV